MPASPEPAYAGVTAFEGMAALAREFDGFIVDQWGILHDGTRPYPGALECLRSLREAGKRRAGRQLTWDSRCVDPRVDLEPRRFCI